MLGSGRGGTSGVVYRHEKKFHMTPFSAHTHIKTKHTKLDSRRNLVSALGESVSVLRRYVPAIA
jgi:hypothetical protein